MSIENILQKFWDITMVELFQLWIKRARWQTEWLIEHFIETMSVFVKEAYEKWLEEWRNKQ